MSDQLYSRSIIKKIIIALACAGIIGAGFFYYKKATQSDIFVYDPARDREQLLKLFRTHWNRLVLNDDYSPEYVFDNLSPKQEDPRYLGTLKVNVMRHDDALIGFTAYYMKNATIGQLLFLVIDEQMWGKRYGQKLLLYGVKQLQCLGAKTIHLFVYKGNTKALKLYHRVGFRIIRDTESGHDMEYMG